MKKLLTTFAKVHLLILIFVMYNPCFAQKTTDPLLEKLKNSPADTIRLLIKSYHNEGNVEKVIFYANELIELSKLKRNDTLHIIGLEMLITEYADNGYFEKSYQLGLEALTLLEEKEINYHYGDIYNSLGILFIHWEDKKKSLEYLKKADSVYRIIKDKTGEIVVKMNLLIWNKNNDEEKIKQYKVILEYWKDIKDKSKIAPTYTNISDIYSSLGDLKTSEKYIDSALVIRKSFNDSIGVSRCFINRADIRTKQKKYKEAIVLLKKAAEANVSKNLLFYKYIYSDLATNYKAINKYDSTIVYLKKENMVKDSIFLNKGYQKFEKALFLEQEKKKTDLLIQINNASKRLNLFLLLFIVFFVTGGFVLFSQKKKFKNITVFLVKKNIEVVEMEEKYTQLYKKIDSPKYSKLDKGVVKNHFDKEQKEVLFSLIKNIIEDHQLFLQTDFSLAKLADILNTNRSYISQVINEFTNDNFPSFINGYRVNEAKKLLLDRTYSYLSIEGIGKSAGFNSSTTFYNSFKKNTGLTPKQFVKGYKTIID